MNEEIQEEDKKRLAILELILKYVNFNTIFTAFCGVVIVAIQTCNHSETINKVQSTSDNQRVQRWHEQQKSDSAFKSQMIIFMDEMRKEHH